MSELELMAVALEEAARAGDLGEIPVGVAIMRGGALIARAGNRRERDADPTAHAEILALREAARTEGGWRLSGAVVAVTLEPCAMCAAALRAARVSRVIYGARDPAAGACGSLLDLLAFPGMGPAVSVYGGLLGKECADLLRVFFAQRRASGVCGGKNCQS